MLSREAAPDQRAIPRAPRKDRAPAVE